MQYSAICAYICQMLMLRLGVAAGLKASLISYLTIGSSSLVVQIQVKWAQNHCDKLLGIVCGKSPMAFQLHHCIHAHTATHPFRPGNGQHIDRASAPCMYRHQLDRNTVSSPYV